LHKDKDLPQMAFFDIDLQFARISIKFDADLPPALLATGTILARVRDQAGAFVFRDFPCDYVQLDALYLVPPTAPERVLELFMPSYGEAQIGFLIDGVFRCGEEVRYSNRLLNMAFDPLGMGSRLRPVADKGDKVAVFTQAFNEGEMLLYWERFYAALVGHENLYVLNNGSTDGSCARLNPATNVINMPEVKVDHVAFAHAHSHFQRFLLMRYQWVIKVATDELLAVEGGLLERLATLPSGTYVPEMALEPVHDKQSEGPFRFDGAVCTQRQHFVTGTPGLIRPLISSVPTSWTPGNHLCFEPSQVLPGFVIAHLRYFDFDFLNEKNAKWAEMKQTEREADTCKQIGALSQLDQAGIEAVTEREIAERFVIERVPLPAWFTAVV
jgi:hypothetical protein